MATDTSNPLLDPNFPYTPQEYADVSRTAAEANTPNFTAGIDTFKPAAEATLKPYYSNLFDQLGTMEQKQTEKSMQTYDDLVKNLQQKYNQRGTFFGGEAIKADTTLAKDEATNLAGIQSDFAGKRSTAAIDQTNQTMQQAAKLQQQAYDDFTANRKQAIETTVSQKLSEYIPGYAKAVQAQLADANNPWLEIPLDAGVDYPAGSTSTTTTDPNNGGNLNGTKMYYATNPAAARTQQAGGDTLVQIGKGTVVIPKNVTPVEQHAIAVELTKYGYKIANGKNDPKAKGKTLVKVGSGYVYK